MLVKMSLVSRKETLEVARSVIRRGNEWRENGCEHDQLVVMVDELLLPWWTIGPKEQFKLNLDELGSDSEQCHCKLAFLGVFKKFSRHHHDRPRWGAELYIGNPNYESREFWHLFQFLKVDCQEVSELGVAGFELISTTTFTLPFLIGMANKEVTVEVEDILRKQVDGPGNCARYFEEAIGRFKSCLGEAQTIATKTAVYRTPAGQLPTVRYVLAGLAFGSQISRFKGHTGAAFREVMR